MRLAQRLLAGSLVVISVLVLFVVAISSERLRDRLYEQTTEELEREARVVAARWTAASAADALADSLGVILGHRVTLVDSAGHVLGDSDFPAGDLGTLENHAQRPEIVGARAHGIGRSQRTSPSRGDDELYVAARAPLGTARVAVGTATVDRIVADARRQVLVAGLVAMVAALLLAFLFARSVSRPVTELSAVARAIANGDLARRPSLSAPGEVGDLAMALHRMTEQLAARLDALQRDDAFTLALLDSLDEGVLAVDAKGRVARANASARKLLGIDRDPPFPVELISRDPVFRGALSGALAGTATDGAELRLGDRTMLLTARALAAGGSVVTLLDLTVLRRLETIRRDFVANVSHELKTPITIIGGFAETLASDDPPPEQRRQFVEAIRSNTHRMQRLVDDLLDLSRIESGSWQPHMAAVDLRAAVSEVVANLAPAAREKGIEIEAVVPADAATLTADPLAIRQILSNLAENALRYTTAGRVTIFTRRDEGRITLGVSDTGIGIPAEHLGRIFERFYRVDAGRSRAGGGTGLGLAIVRHLAESHGGRVAVTSELGKGTTVSATFPAAA
ncbi:MAG: HAMP domain-containing protein [Gemmatimonadaceae bacterium]|nr:HAMP domain-containing protein [Gemmatimonadaceae bacterium]NUQ93750.1 HAMP domain-containing protein [Gemmatimonadaceae bacterium]NUS96379.1 HAMP domain-containing protein [Gemmatimonadaceae bacterium]